MAGWLVYVDALFFFFFNYLLALIGGPTFLEFFFKYKLRNYKKKIVSRAEIKNRASKLDVPPGFWATRLVSVATPAGAEAAHAAAPSTLY